MVMRSWREQLPLEYLEEPIFSRLSTDAQLYFACSSCAVEYRLNPTVCFGDPEFPIGMDCRRCDSGQLSAIRHLDRVQQVCGDCETPYTAETSGFEEVRCPNCQSSRYLHTDLAGASYTAEFGDIAGGQYIWGRDPAEDAQKIAADVQIGQGLPDAMRYAIPAALFARRLHEHADYPADLDHSAIINVEGNLLRDYFRRTGELSAGIAAVSALEETVELAVDDVRKGLCEHNVAMAVYSILSKHRAEVVNELMGRQDVTADGLAAAERALDIFTSGPHQDQELYRSQAARIHHLIGDYHKVTATSEMDLRRALFHFDMALASDALSDDLRNGVLQSRAAVTLAFDTPTRDQREQAAADLKSVLSRDERNRVWSNKLPSWLNQATALEAAGKDRRAWRAIHRAAGIAQDELDRAIDEISMSQAAEAYVLVFDKLARISAKLGRAEEALGAVETVRAAAVRVPDVAAGSDPDPEALRRTIHWQGRVVRSMFTGRGAAKSTPRKANLQTVRERLRHIGDDVLAADTAFLCYSMCDLTITALIVTRSASGALQVEPLQWRVDFEHAADIGLPLEAGDELAVNVDRVCRAGFETLLAPVYPTLAKMGLKRVAVSLPGPLTRIAFEAMASLDDRIPAGGGFEFSYLPSLSLGIELAQRQRPRRPDLLVVSYLEDDLPEADQEVEQLQAAFEGRVTVFGGTRATKAELLAAIQGDFGHLHFLCHGTFDPLEPLESALHLVADPQSDRHRVTAKDLTRLKLQHGCTVTLSACSSGLTSYGMANDLSGLAGGFIRAGARGVIGSRWDVHDDASASFMSALYQRLADPVVSPVTAVAQAQNVARRDYPETEDWAAFGYLGIP